MAAPVEVVRLAQAIEQFKGRAPRDLPDGVLDGLEQVDKLLKDYAPIATSPGRKAAAQAAGTEGTGEHFRQAAKGPDGPSPGQREAMNASLKIREAAESMKDHLG